MSVARRRQTSSRVSIGHITESIPSSFVAAQDERQHRRVQVGPAGQARNRRSRRCTSSSASTTRASRRRPDRRRRPTVAFSSGRVPICERRARQDVGGAERSQVIVFRIFAGQRGHGDSRAPPAHCTAMLPTPPVAPVTITGPSAGVRPFRSKSTTESAAVKPAVPIAITSDNVRPGGTRHDPVRRHAHVLGIAAVVRRAEVVSGDEDLVARS